MKSGSAVQLQALARSTMAGEVSCSCPALCLSELEIFIQALDICLQARHLRTFYNLKEVILNTDPSGETNSIQVSLVFSFFFFFLSCLSGRSSHGDFCSARRRSSQGSNSALH